MFTLGQKSSKDAVVWGLQGDTYWLMWLKPGPLGSPRAL